MVKWLQRSRPSLVSLAEFSVADARMLALSLHQDPGQRFVDSLRVLLGASPVIADAVRDELARHRGPRDSGIARQPYTEQEYRRITVVARGIVRRARDRLREHHGLITDYRAGVFDQVGVRDRRRCLAAALEHYDCTGDVPRGAGGSPSARSPDAPSPPRAGSAWASCCTSRGRRRGRSASCWSA